MRAVVPGLRLAAACHSARDSGNRSQGNTGGAVDAHRLRHRGRRAGQARGTGRHEGRRVARPGEPDQGRGPAGGADLVDLGADARGDVRDRGVEPALSGGRRLLHDRARPAPAGHAGRAADRHAGHLRSRRQPPRHGALRRAARLPDLRQPGAEEGCRLHDGRGGAGGSARGHHRPRGRPGGAHPGRGRQAVANHLRRAGAASARARAASTSTSGRSAARASSPRGRASVCSPSTGSSPISPTS